MKRRRAQREAPTHVVLKPVELDPRIGYAGHRPEFVSIRDITEPGTRQPVASPQNVNTDRHTWLFAHELIERRQYDASEILLRDWQASEQLHFASAVMVGAGGRYDHHPNDVKIGAMRRFGDAREAMGYAWPVIQLVVLDGKSVDQAAVIRQMHPKRYMGMLWIGLHMLADHYGIGGSFEFRRKP